MIRVDGIRKRFGRTDALKSVSFDVARGEVLGFVGPNGAGKTTTLRIISGFLSPDAGRVTIGGADVAEEPGAALRALGYMPESAPLYREMRVGEYLRHRARLKGVRRGDLGDRLASVAVRAGLEDMLRALVGQLSKGYRQRVALADVLIAEPEVLLLDEPTAGLDPIQREQFRELVHELQSEHSIVLSSHLLGDVETIASRFVLLFSGEVVADGDLPSLRAELDLADDASLDEIFQAHADKDAGRR